MAQSAGESATNIHSRKFCASGVNNFPVELLCSIFRFAKAKPYPHLGTVDVHRQNLSVVRLTWVCQLWRNVAIQDSVLWCNIAFSTSRLSTIRCAIVFLHRSRGATLKVQIIDIKNHGTIAHTALVASLVDDIAVQSHRIVEFEAVGLSELVSEALVHRADNLDRLTITGHSSGKLPIIFDGQIPRLKRLTLSNPAGWTLRLFQYVTKVALFCNGGDLRMSSLVSFLDGARNLEVLSLSRYRDYTTDSRMAVQQPVALPSLRELSLSFCDASRILGYLDLPPSAHVSILTGSEYEDQHIFQCLPNAPNFWRFLSDTKSLTLTLSTTDNEYYLSTCRRGKSSCFLRVYDDRKRLGEGWVFRSVNVASQFKRFFHIDSLTVSVEDYPVPWKAWLQELDQLVGLEVRSVNPEEVAIALRPARAGRNRVLCPSLRYLTIEVNGSGATFNPSALKACLLARAVAGHPVFRLRVRSDNWEDAAQIDTDWNELVISQGEVPHIVGVIHRLPSMLETSGGFTTILMRSMPDRAIGICFFDRLYIVLITLNHSAIP